MCDIHPGAISERDVHARLPHTCYSCDKMIAIGETYRNTSGIWDGEPSRYRQHLLCAVLEQQLRDDEGCFTFGSLASAADFDPPSPTFHRAWEAVFGRPWLTTLENS